MDKKTKTKKELLEELTALREELKKVQSAQTWRRKTDKALKRSEENYRALSENLADGYYEVDLKGNMTFFNDALCRILEYPREELLGMNNRQHSDAENARIAYQAFNRVYRTGEPSQGVRYGLITKNGNKRTIETSISLIKGSSGKPIGFRGIARDITDLIQSQEALQKSEERYRTIIETIADGYYEVDLKGNLTFFNDALAKNFGYSRDELKGMNSRQYTDAVNNDRMHQVFSRIFQTGEPEKGLRFETITKNKTKRDMELSIALIRDGSGNPVGFRGIARDITDLVQIQKELHKSEERYRTILETSEEGYYEVDLTGNLLFFNDALARVHGLSRHEMLRAKSRGYTDAENQRKIQREYEQVFLSGKPSKGVRYEISTRNKERRNLEVSIDLMRDASGNPCGFRGITRDITEEIKTRNDLKTSEERYRIIIETIEDGYYEVDLTGNFTYVNEAMARLTGYSAKELLSQRSGKEAIQYTDVENAQILSRAFTQIYQTGEPSKGIIYRALHKNGEWKTISTSATLIRDEQGNPKGFRGISRDITDLIRIQNDLKTSEERYRTIIETIEDGYYEVDLQGNFTFFNEALVRIFEYPKQELMGMNNRQYTDVENAQIVFQAFNQVYRTEAPLKGLRYEMITKDKRKTLEVSISLVKDASGRPVGFRGISRDITGLIQVQKALKESEERYRTIIETIEDGYAEVDLTGNFTFFNEAMVRIFEYPRQELMGMNNRQYTDAENAKILFKAFSRVFETGEPSKGTRYEMITKNNKKKNLEVSNSLMRDVSGKPVGFRGITRDITDLIQIQEALRKSEERYRTIIETIEDGYYEVNLKGSLTYFNDVMVGIHEYPRDELMGMNNRQYTDTENARKVYQAFSRVYRTGEPFKGIHYEIITKGGGRKNLETSVSLIRDPNGNPLGFRGIARDVTELVQAQKALISSEERFRIVAENTNDFIYEWDLPSGQIEWIGNAGEKFKSILGELPVTAADFDRRIHPDDRDRTTEGVINHLRKGGTYQEEYRMIGKDGNIIHLSGAGMGVRDETGRVKKWIGAVSDITERKKIEHALLNSEERFRVAAQSSNDFIYEWDLPSDQLKWFGNIVKQLEQLLGEIPQTNAAWSRLIHPEDLERLSEAVRRHLKQGEPFREEYRMIGKSGNLIHVEGAGMSLKDETGRAYKWVGVLSDITERKKAELALLSSEERFRIIAQNTNDFIYEWDLKTGQYEWFGAAVEKLGNILGELPADETIYGAMIHPDDFERVLRAARLLISEGIPFLEEYRFVGKTGNIICVKDAGMCLRGKSGRAYKWVGALSDITDRKRTEEELKQSFEKVRKAMGGIIQAMALTVESKDPYTAGHQQRVSRMARTIAQEMGLPKDQIEAIRMAGVVHDLGKISVPAEILSKPTKLSDLEFSLIKNHPQTSYEILKDIDFPWPIAEIALQHHERMDGSGYPAGLKGDEIMIEAQVLMVADVVEAIASHRPYRPSLGIELAMEEILKNRGILYNPAAVDACIRLFREKDFNFNQPLFSGDHSHPLPGD